MCWNPGGNLWSSIWSRLMRSSFLLQELENVLPQISKKTTGLPHSLNFCWNQHGRNRSSKTTSLRLHLRMQPSWRDPLEEMLWLVALLLKLIGLLMFRLVGLIVLVWFLFWSWKNFCFACLYKLSSCGHPESSCPFACLSNLLMASLGKRGDHPTNGSSLICSLWPLRMRLFRSKQNYHRSVWGPPAAMGRDGPGGLCSQRVPRSRLVVLGELEGHWLGLLLWISVADMVWGFEMDHFLLWSHCSSIATVLLSRCFTGSRWPTVPQGKFASLIGIPSASIPSFTKDQRVCTMPWFEAFKSTSMQAKGRPRFVKFFQWFVCRGQKMLIENNIKYWKERLTFESWDNLLDLHSLYDVSFLNWISCPLDKALSYKVCSFEAQSLKLWILPSSLLFIYLFLYDEFLSSDSPHRLSFAANTPKKVLSSLFACTFYISLCTYLIISEPNKIFLSTFFHEILGISHIFQNALRSAPQGAAMMSICCIFVNAASNRSTGPWPSATGAIARPYMPWLISCCKALRGAF